MTNQERAEKIIQYIESIYGKRTGWVVDFITSQFDEAVREAVKPLTLDEAKAHFEDGFSSAREQAAGIADEYIPGQGLTMSERIRAMEPEEKR